MPAFQAINVEPEENIDDEIDTTRELHVDEALKRFQTALKLHAQGPRFFDEAADAYDDLFKSEIFKYPEAATEYDRAERHPDQLITDAALAGNLELQVADVDTATSSLPQAFFLAHKNRGQFLLDKTRHAARVDGATCFEKDEALQNMRSALTDFNAALDRDPSDAELWRRTARVAASLKSSRISRYCLEAAIELDDDPAVLEVEPPSLAEGFAGQQLKDQLQVLGDEIALSHPIMGPWVKREMPDFIKRHLDPIPFLPNPIKDLESARTTIEETGKTRLTITLPNASWVDLGMALIHFVLERGQTSRAVVIELPEMEVDEDVVMESQPEQESQVNGSEAKEGSVDNEKKPEANGEKKSVENDKTGDEKEATPEEAPKVPETTRETRKGRSASQPNRKRSQSAAGLPENQDDESLVEKRSKRIRRRETAQAEEVIDPSAVLATQLAPYQAADQNLFQATKNMLENIGVTNQAVLDRISEVLDSLASEDRAASIKNQATMDLRNAIVSFSEENAKILLNKQAPASLSLSSFLEHAKGGSQKTSVIPPFKETQGIAAFAKRVNASWMTAQEVAYEWIKTICPSYLQTKWSDAMKTAVVQVISRFDQDILQAINYDLECAHRSAGSEDAYAFIKDIVEMLFEIHLDVYERITNPNSVVDYSIRVEAKGRLGRWLDIASGLLRGSPQEGNEKLTARFLWAAIFSTTLTENASREYILQCWTSLRDFLADGQVDQLYLPNNPVIPEISEAAADREISKLTTMDFFLGLFQDNVSDPVAVIENLEPVLNPSSVYVSIPPEESAKNGEGSGRSKPKKVPIKEYATQSLQDLWRFLLGTSTELRLFLWSRLSDAYGTIKYSTKQFSCQLKAIEMLTADLESDSYLKNAPETRPPLLLKMLKSLDDLLITALSLALNDTSAYDIVDEEHLRTTSAALAKLSSMLHASAMHEDEIRIGMTRIPPNSPSFQAFLNKLREIQVRVWCLQYTVIKVGVNQNRTMFPQPEMELADYLSAIHQVLGLRKCCKASNKIFLKMMRVELLKFKNIENWEDYLGQVLYDLHGLKLGVGVGEVQDHGCPPEKLEKRNAMQLVDKITVLARRMPRKDLLKSDLKTTIEHMQGAIGQTKSTPQMIHNLRNFTEYLKRPIHPLRLYQALTGGVQLDVVAVNTPESALAKHGWFFLLGMIALTRFKQVDLSKRQTPGATDDLRLAATFLRLQLQFTPDKWDAWFRLAECFDYELDEAVLWSADKMNKERGELLKFQRNSIHCYTLALSNSWEIDIDDEDEDPLYELYHNFAMRLYASSREPLAMEPFQHADHERFFIENMGNGTFKRAVHEEMQDYKVWKYAAGLFKRAMRRKPQDWRNPFMLTKCLWKMYQKPVDQLSEKNRQTRPSVDYLISALEHAVEVVAAVPKSRHSDPILEPHYKIVSIVHKLVIRNDLTWQEGADILSRQPFGMELGDDITMNDVEDWEEYVIRNLHHLRDKDKSNWQHRIIMRHARLLFDEDGESPELVQAKAAFNVLRESMFTKTMVMNVWKCDAERPGRHHVYTTQYIRFMVRLLVIMNDRVNLEMVLRRLRKKGADFYHFSDLWQHCCMAYVRLLRQGFQISQTLEDSFKSTSMEELEIMADRITEWAGGPATDIPAFNCLKETIELKKLNGGLMKAGALDDLINDCYAIIYQEIGPTLPGPEPHEVLEARARARAREEADGGGELKPQNSLGNLLNPQGSQDSVAMEESGDKTAAAPEAAPRRRVGVRRPDIIRKAEQAFARFGETPKAAIAPSKSRVGSVSSGRMGHTPTGDVDEGSDAEEHVEGAEGREDGEDVEMKDDTAVEAEEGEEMDEGEEGEEAEDGEEEAPAQATAASSPRGSIHDSADDESELSDVPDDWDEEPPPSMLFPNLRKSVDTAREASGDSTEEEEEDEEGEEGEDEDEAEDEEVAKMCTYWKAKREDCGHTVYRWEVRCQEARIKKKACKAWTYRTEWEMGLCNECLTESRYVWKSSYA
ncbi:Histone transcription regulator 3 [Colletotrichum sp. SAR 10_70]|nr:Histone transcription regulator 3 [Colletotrichum sp. SAR 10_71]KAI8162643.1 Histone transcription regulator 3 [Colletotrichum sp. SAR 10_70]KAI8182259.1 Histone transcription regulator 3 [Colletotrichum sp. SAR 10_75]KAI8205987.1 Histone transcription regulator 3 [Colletotrichum sp. SAR 10_76]KAI8226471.1 Histone transcription regulator 3 [Colletotrichum sp. SAR 10_86]KAJ4997459.1 Histone transcription regulator 3 [Colletotrichum sp. SAR 10_66]